MADEISVGVVSDARSGRVGPDHVSTTDGGVWDVTAPLDLAIKAMSGTGDATIADVQREVWAQIRSLPRWEVARFCTLLAIHAANGLLAQTAAENELKRVNEGSI